MVGSRAGTAVATNDAKVGGAESRNDIIPKLGIVRKELCGAWNGSGCSGGEASCLPSEENRSRPN